MKLTYLLCLLAIALPSLATSTPAEEAVTADVPIQQQPIDCSHMFIPTGEWKPIHPDECVPAGLHLRMNFETGVREGKLRDGEEGDAGTEVVLVRQDEEGLGVPPAAAAGVGHEEEEEEGVMYLQEGLSDEDLLLHLSHLEDQVSRIDDGIALMESTHVKARLLALLSSSPNPLVRAHAARVYADAVSNNLLAQQAALSTIDVILGALDGETNPQARKSVVHAVASLVRGNKVSSRVFWTHGGFNTLRNVFGQGDRRIQNKVKELVVDLFDVDMLVEGSGRDEEGLQLMVGAGFCGEVVVVEEDLCEEARRVVSENAGQSEL
ncbi:hypothetical protein HDU98_002971 [Podochytrium sp. JEL0797]|nr:hypothetical protein HDU98_002971 [Podochytrium sp. JEL0797]